MKMEKTPRYTQRERNMVLGFAAQYKDVIENKRTDAESNRKKDEVWRQIAKEFNARVYHQRSSKQLRQLYKNMKLLLKKDLCGEGKGNRSFMDLLNTLSQQESVAQYISEQMSPGGYSGSGRPQKYDDEYDDSKMHSMGYDGMDHDVIVIKSEDISDNDQSHNPDDMDDDDDDCLSPKDIPEVCLEEEDDEIFATDLRQPMHQRQQQLQLLNAHHAHASKMQHQHMQQQQPEVTIQNIGGIRVGSIGSIANLKAMQNGGNNSALSIGTPNTSGNGSMGAGDGSGNNGNNNNGSGNGANNSSGNSNANGSSNNLNSRVSAEQHLLLNGLGLSAVHPNDAAAAAGPHPPPPLPTLQRGTHHSNNNGGGGGGGGSSSGSGAANQFLLNLNRNNYGNHHHHKLLDHFGGGGGGGGSSSSHNNHSSNHNHHHHSSTGSSGRNEYLMSLAIEERKRKIDLLNAQIDYWKTLTKKLDANTEHNPTPTCLCHFPGKVNGLQTPTSSS